MSQKKYTTKERKFKHLDMYQRGKIELMLKMKIPKAQIARELGISRSTLYEEIKRGTVPQLTSELVQVKRYFADSGQRVYEERRKSSRNPYKLAAAIEFVTYAETQILKNKLSPDAICGREALEHRFPVRICTKTLYNYIAAGLVKVKNIDLLQRVKRKPSQNSPERKNKRLYGESIENRPAHIDTREEFGHWEIDTIVGKKETQEVLLTLDERTTRKLLVVKIASRTATAVREALLGLVALLGDRAREVFKSITSDNGSEFSSLPDILPKTNIYYAHPYSSFERGTNENQNGLIRRFFPKGTDFSKVSDEAIRRVQNWINSLPRKIHAYRSSDELFRSYFSDCPI